MVAGSLPVRDPEKTLEHPTEEDPLSVTNTIDYSSAAAYYLGGWFTQEKGHKMNKHSKVCFRAAVILALLLTCLGQEMVAFAAEPALTARIILSRRRVHPGETVEFGLELVDSRGQSQQIPG